MLLKNKDTKDTLMLIFQPSWQEDNILFIISE